MTTYTNENELAPGTTLPRWLVDRQGTHGSSPVHLLVWATASGLRNHDTPVEIVGTWCNVDQRANQRTAGFWVTEDINHPALCKRCLASRRKGDAPRPIPLSAFTVMPSRSGDGARGTP